MVNKICFFAVGFAFNRLVRLRYYEKIFPEDIEIFLFTTNKYKEKEYTKHELKRTKIIYSDYNPNLPFKFIKFCKKNKISRIINLGDVFSGWLLLFVALFSKSDYILNIVVNPFRDFKAKKTLLEKLKNLFKTIFFLPPIVLPAKKVIYNDFLAEKFLKFMCGKQKVEYLPAPINTKLFTQRNKKKCREKLKLPDKKIIMFVGRFEWEKCSNIFTELIKENNDVFFIIIGRIINEDIYQLDRDNFKVIEKVGHEDLIDYYNASDLCFSLNRNSGGIGLATVEALSCGIPAIISRNMDLRNKESKVLQGKKSRKSRLFWSRKLKPLFESSFEIKEVEDIVQNFFKKTVKEKKELSKMAMNYVENIYSEDKWKDKYLDVYLN